MSSSKCMGFQHVDSGAVTFMYGNGICLLFGGAFSLFGSTLQREAPKVRPSRVLWRRREDMQLKL